MNADLFNAMAEFTIQNDRARAIIEHLADSLLEIMKDIPLDDLIFFEERQHHQRMIYAVYFAPKRSSN